MLYSVTIEKYQNTQWIAVFFFLINGCIKPVSVPMLTPQPLPKPRRRGTWASELDSWTTDSDESQFLLHHMDGWVLCILYLVNSWQQNALWKECKPTESPCLHISVSKGGSIKKKKKKEAGGHNLIPDRYTSHQLMLSKCYHIGVLLGTSLL